MSQEVITLLKYDKDVSLKICPFCETENRRTYEKCSFCGAGLTKPVPKEKTFKTDGMSTTSRVITKPKPSKTTTVPPPRVKHKAKPDCVSDFKERDIKETSHVKKKFENKTLFWIIAIVGVFVIILIILGLQLNMAVSGG